MIPSHWLQRKYIASLWSYEEDSAEGHDGMDPLSFIIFFPTQSQDVPHDLKVARVTPIYKSGDNNIFKLLSNFYTFS